MTSSTIYSIQPYFYIIRHIPTGMLYAGCKFAKDSDPNNFMKPGGYTTSSSKVNELLEQDGFKSFEIVQLMEEEFCGIDVYSYETRFLRNYDIASRMNWLNYHNNHIAPFGSKEFKILLLKLYGVDHCSDIPGIYEKMKSTLLDRYGVDNAFKSPELMVLAGGKRLTTMLDRYGTINPYLIEGNNIVENRKNTMLEKFGVEYIWQHPQFIEENVIKVKATKLLKYGDENYNNTEKNCETKLLKYGDENYNNRDAAKTTCLERFGVSNYTQTDEYRKNLSETLKTAPVLKCTFCDREGKSPSIFRHIKLCQQKSVGTTAQNVWHESKKSIK